MLHTKYHSAAVGKNSPCPCGSGKKHKKCCLNLLNVVPCKLIAKTPLSFLKQTTDSLDISEDFGKGPRHANAQYPKWDCRHTGKKNERIIDHITELVNAKRGRRRANSWLDTTWTKDYITEHCNGFRKVYFSGAGHWKQRYTMVMIDVDCKKRGTPEGARAFLEFLEANYFPNLFMEVSTNGRGGHGFFLIDKGDFSAEVINPVLLHQLAPWLNKLCRNFDVEFVEVKGTLPVVEFTREGVRYTAGQPAKVPRGLISRFEELKNTCCIHITDLMQLPVVEDKQIIVPASAGSMSGKHITPEMLSGLEAGGCYHTVAAELFAQKGVQRLKLKDRNTVTVDDLAIFLLLTEFFTNNRESNGGLPGKRIEKLWRSLEEAEDVSRKYNHHKIKEMRNLLSDLGLIDWTDESYQIGWWEGEVWKKGVCMKWCLGSELMEMLQSVRDSLSCEEGGRHPLWMQISNTLHHWVSELTFCLPEDEIRPIEILRLTHRRVHPDQATAVVGYFEIQVA